MASVEMKLNGDFEAALNRLAAAVGESALRSAGVAGAAVFRDEVQALAPVATGFLKSQVIMAHADDKSQGNQRQTYVVRVRRGSQTYGNTRLNRRKNRIGKSFEVTDAFYWKFLEYGTSKMAAKPFIRPAWEARRAHALDVMRKRLWEKIQEGLRA